MKTLTVITLIAATIAGGATAAAPESSEVEDLINALAVARAAVAQFEATLEILENWRFLMETERAAADIFRDDVEIPSTEIISGGPANLI